VGIGPHIRCVFLKYVDHLIVIYMNISLSEDMKMKRFLFGVLVSFIGFVSFLFCFIYAITNPWNYNGITGLLGSLLGTGLLVPFIISLVVLAAGLIISCYEAYRRE
jgi:uncharacterized BrkB/YihY/UPF0761 family membrane protein